MQNSQIPGAIQVIGEQNCIQVMRQVECKSKVALQDQYKVKERVVSLQVVQQNKGNSERTEVKCFQKKRNFIILTIVSLLALLSVGLGVGLWLHLQTKIVEVKPSIQINFGSQEAVVMTEMTIKEVYLFRQNIQFSIIKTSIARSASSRLLQEGPRPGQFTTTIHFKQLGVTAHVGQDQSVTLILTPNVLQNEISSQNAQAAHRLDTRTIRKEQSQQDFNTLLKKALSELTDQNRPISISRRLYFNLVVEPKSKKLQLAQTMKTTRLLVQRVLFSEKLKARFATVVKTVIQVVRKAGPMIGAVVGAVAQIIAGQPGMAFEGAKEGYGYGSLAQSFVKACIPQNATMIKCDSQVLSQQATKKGIGQELAQVKIFSQLNPIKK